MKKSASARSSAKLSLRITLLSSILILVLFTFLVVWGSTKRGLRASVETMAESISLEALARVRERTQTQLNGAQAAGGLAIESVRRVESEVGRPLEFSDWPRVTSRLRAIMQAYPSLSFLSVSLAAHGEYAHVQRRGEALVAVEMTRPVNGVATQRYVRYDGSRRIVERVDKNHRYDPRTRPFFKAAARARHAVWTDSYPFVEPDGVTYPGLSLAMPVYEQGRLAFVVTADFSSAELCDFLRGLTVGETGYAFVVDDRADGSKVLLAHPDRNLLLQTHGGQTELTRLDQLRDPLLRQLMQRIVRSRTSHAAFVGKIGDEGGFFPDGLSGLASDRLKREYFVSYDRISGTPDPGLSLGTLVPAAEFTSSLVQHERAISIVALVVLLLGILVSWLISIAVSRPLNAAVRQLGEVGRMQFDLPPVMRSGLVEVSELADSIDQMKIGLRAFSRYVPTDQVRRVLAAGDEPALGGEVRTLTIHFCDIVGFTSLAEKVPLHELLPLLGECLGALSEEIMRSNGTIDKYIGDNIMAFWGAPEPLPQHAEKACRAVLRNRETMVRLRQNWVARGLPPLHTRTALHTGPAIVGNIGSEQRMNYTAMGDTVNVASRLEGINRLYRTEILISEVTWHAAGEAIIARPIDWVRVDGREKPLRIFEPLGFRDTMDEAAVRRACLLAELSEHALTLYRERNWRAAADAFGEVLRLLPNDGAATLLQSRCIEYQSAPPPASWQGIGQTSKY